MTTEQKFKTRLEAKFPNTTWSASNKVYNDGVEHLYIHVVKFISDDLPSNNFVWSKYGKDILPKTAEEWMALEERIIKAYTVLSEG